MSAGIKILKQVSIHRHRYADLIQGFTGINKPLFGDLENMEKRGNKNFEISILFTFVPIKEQQ